MTQTSSSLCKSFFRYAMLNVLGMVGLSCYILADTFFISKGLGANGLAALNLAIPVYSFIHGSGLMLGMGGATRYSVLQGQGSSHTHEAKLVFLHTLHMLVLFAALFVLLGIFCSEGITALLGANEEIFSMTKTYLQVILLFSPAFLLNEVLICFVRNDGNPRLPMLGMLFGSLSNIVLDYIFIFPFHLGILGAVLATGFAPLVSMAILSFHWFSKKNSAALKLKHFFVQATSAQALSSRLSLARQTISLGFPSLISEVASGVVMIVFNFLILSLQGNLGVAAYGVIANLSLVVNSIYTGIAQGMQPLASQAYGQTMASEQNMTSEQPELQSQKTGRPNALRQIFRYAITTTLLVSAVLYAGIFLFADPITRVFNSEQNATLQEIAVLGLKLYFTSIPFTGFNILLTTFFISTMKALPAQIISLLRGLLLVIPLAFLLSALADLNGVWLTLPLTEAIVALLGIGLMRRK